MIRPKYETRSRQNSTTKKTKGISRAAYAACVERSGGVCEGCGVARAPHIHHRLYRSRGGLDELANLIHLCVKHHNEAHTAAGERFGWSVKSGNDPEQVPVFHKGSQSWTLNDEPVNEVVARELMFAYGQTTAGVNA